ncbi:MAG: phage minor head protein [Pseudomonadota bacterium]
MRLCKKSNENYRYSEQYYIWRTSADNRVRHTHAANEGKMFSVDHPPPSGYPKDDYGCRCVADHNIPDYVSLPEQKILKDSLSYFMRYGNDGCGSGRFMIM